MPKVKILIYLVLLFSWKYKYNSLCRKIIENIIVIRFFFSNFDYIHYSQFSLYSRTVSQVRVIQCRATNSILQRPLVPKKQFKTCTCRFFDILLFIYELTFKIPPKVLKDFFHIAVFLTVFGFCFKSKFIIFINSSISGLTFWKQCT